MISELEGLTDLAAELSRRARASGMMLFWRAQTRSVRRLVVRNGKTESTTMASVSGQGMQVVTPDGRVALASRDDFRAEPAARQLERLVAVAAAGERLGLARAPLPALEPLRDRRVPEHHEAFEEIDLAAVARELAELESEIAGRVPGLSLQISYRAELDAWRIVRSDGSDVLFAMPRCTLGMRATTGGDGTRHGVGAVVFSPRPDLVGDAAVRALFLRRAEQAARLARDLPDAPTHPAGSYPLVIDYALAKGLAHEAFGHAAEADGFRSSILAENGRFRSGQQVGADHVSIIDEPVEGDHAWQPFSANALRRERAVIVDHGRLADGLSDPWSAEPGGVRLTGSARAESFRSAPQPRMSNIRVEVDAPLPAPGAFEDYGPREVRELLREAGVLERHPRVVFLSGYSGGQVNTASGDFVFNCKAIYELGPQGVKLFKPAVFSGSMFGALQSVREAFGPLLLDAIGYCGKWGQQVPSSGGSHYFLVLDADPTVRLGGAEVELGPIIEALRSHTDVRDWSLSVTDAQRLSLGVKDRQTGNAHAPLTLTRGGGARYLVVWSDGLVSRGHLERRQIEVEPAAALRYARAAAYDDPDAAQVLGPAEFPDVPLHDPAAAAVAGGDTAAFAERLALVRERVASGGFRTWSGSFSASEAEARLVSSAGLEVSGRGTSIGWHVTLDGEIGDGFAARRAESDADFASRLERLTDVALRLREPAAPMAGGMLPVMLHPRVVAQYVLDTLLHHLEGATIDHGESRFRPEQFGSDEPVLREDIGLRLDPLQPYKSGSYRFSGEGLPAAPAEYVADGRLVQPVLDLKYARRLGLPPTPTPYASDVLAFTGRDLLDLEAAQGLATGGALVLSVLGVHTQDSASGDFSLSAPQALRIGPDGFAGRLRATISGNLFDVLRHPDLHFVSFPGEPLPGLLLPCRLDPK